jgi:hypothetical protein
LLAAEKEIVLGNQRHEIELELPGRGLHAESDVRHVAGDIGGEVVERLAARANMIWLGDPWGR